MHARLMGGLLLALISVGGAASADTLAKIRDTGRFVIGYREDARPFSFKTDKGQPAGYSVDLCRIIAEAIKRRVGRDDLAIEFVPVTAKARLDSVVSGDVDIECGSSTHTLSRRERVDFTLSTFVTGAEMLLQAESPIQNLTDLGGRKVGVLKGTTTESGLRATLEQQEIKAEIATFDEHEKGLEALEKGEVDAYFADRILLLGLMGKAKDPAALRLSGRFYSYEPYAFMVRRDDDDLRLVADAVLADLFRSGEIWKIYAAYFGEAQPSELLVALYLLQGLPAR